jgi:membrane-associated phospholipid phosphatase
MADWSETVLNLDTRASAYLRLPQPARNGRSSRDPRWVLAVILAHSGDSWLWMGLLGLVWLFGGPAWRSRSALMILAVGVQALVIFAIKQAIRRERPQGEWGGIYRTIDPHSFPSGHATRAVLLAVIAWGLGLDWLALLLMIWAPLVSLARVSTGVHYLSDVLAGWVIGLMMGCLLLAAQGKLIQTLPFLFH